MRLQSVDLRVPDVETTARFFAEVWGLERVPGNRLRGMHSLPYRVGLEQGPPAIGAITFCGSDISDERELKGPEGETYRFFHEQAVPPLERHRYRPIRLSHVVLNSKEVDAAERFATEKLGFRVSDRTPLIEGRHEVETGHPPTIATGRMQSSEVHAAGHSSSVQPRAFDAILKERSCRGRDRGLRIVLATITIARATPPYERPDTRPASAFASRAPPLQSAHRRSRSLHRLHPPPPVFARSDR